MDLRDNRVFIRLTAVRPDGTKRTVRFWVDTGGGAVILSETLVHDLGLKPTGSVSREGKNAFQPVDAPQIRIDGMAIDFKDVPVLAAVGSQAEVSPGSGAEGLLPARVLKKYEVVFDYPGRTFTLAQPGSLQPVGTPMPSPIQTQSGFPRIELTVRGVKYGFLLDTGAAYTMVSSKLIDKWIARNPGWQHSVGAVGPANMVGGSLDANAELLRLPSLQWGPFDLHAVGIVSRPPGTFETYMSPMMTGPIVGSVAGNILRAFRVEIDYTHGITYLEKRADVNPHDLDTVGVIIQARHGGEYAISGVAHKNGNSVVQNVESGDNLLRVGSFDCIGASLADVLHALRGKPGQKKTLVLMRKGKRVIVKAPVTRLP